ncbi:hypothetical protein D9611_011744 [Ephemerocybe angulata]|uniref:C2H2-type domain-containing protein n=1 Tax=Ephemerocybe angulata TaxID=980116 RepID=A0A8H5C5D2_9AGAR|nr:hypothetical protein D9611_011744 [Tulosesus angulatus]
MRVSILSIVSLTLALANFVSGHSDDALHAREYVDDLSLRETNTDVLADISTRDLISELSERLERREEYVDDLSLRETNTDVLADISTRDLISELSERLERRDWGTPHRLLKCPHCHRQFIIPTNLVIHIAEVHSGQTNQPKPVNGGKAGRR